MSKQYRGMRRFGEQPSRRDDERWDDNLMFLEPPPKRTPILIRPVGGIFTVGVHYVKFLSPKTGKETGFYTLCPNWNLEQQEDEDRGCPVCADFGRWLKVPEDQKYLRMPQKYRYLFHAFHVSNIKDGVKDPAKRFGLVQTHAIGIKKIEESMMIKGNIQPDDPKNGYCLVWLLTDGEKGSQYGPEVSFSGGDKMPAREKEPGVWQLKMGKNVVTANMQDLVDVIPQPPTADELRKKLAGLGLYTALERATGATIAVRSVDDEPPTDASDWDENQDGGSDDAGADWDDTDDTDPDEGAGPDDADADADDEWETDADDSSDSDDEWDADGTDTADDTDADADDEWETEEEEPEPEPEPEKPKRGKKGGKKSGKKGGKKKPEPEPEPEEEESDDPDDVWDADDWDDDDE